MAIILPRVLYLSSLLEQLVTPVGGFGDEQENLSFNISVSLFVHLTACAGYPGQFMVNVLQRQLNSGTHDIVFAQSYRRHAITVMMFNSTSNLD